MRKEDYLEGDRLSIGSYVFEDFLINQNGANSIERENSSSPSTSSRENHSPQTPPPAAAALHYFSYKYDADNLDSTYGMVHYSNDSLSDTIDSLTNGQTSPTSIDNCTYGFIAAP